MQGLVVGKPISANPGLKVTKDFTSLVLKCFQKKFKLEMKTSQSQN